MTSGRPRLLTRLARALLGRGAAGQGEVTVPLRERFQVVRDDLLREYTRDEVEQHERATDPLGGVAPVPFGHLNPVWQRFCSVLEPGDQIWRFNAQRVAANGEAVIRSGYVAVRQGVPQRPMVATFRTVGADAPLARLAASTEPVTADLLGPPRPAVGQDRSNVVDRTLDAVLADRNGPATALPASADSTLASANQTDGGTNASKARHQEPATVE